MTREEAIQIFNEVLLFGKAQCTQAEFKELAKMSIKALVQEPTKNDLVVEDCISRAETLKAMDTWDKFGYTETGAFVREPKGDYIPYVHYADMVQTVKNMPSVEPKAKTGHWIAVYQGDEIINYRCSECEFGNTFGKSTIGMNFCPNCGAKMDLE